MSEKEKDNIVDHVSSVRDTQAALEEISRLYCTIVAASEYLKDHNETCALQTLNRAIERTPEGLLPKEPETSGGYLADHCGDETNILGEDGDLLQTVKGHWTQEEVDLWGAGFERGMFLGREAGRRDKVAELKSAVDSVREILGLDPRVLFYEPRFGGDVRP